MTQDTLTVDRPPISQIQDGTILLPEDIQSQLNIQPPFDFSSYQGVHTKAYDYYPEIPAMIVLDTVVHWDSEDSECIDPANPEHLRWIQDKLFPTRNAVGLISVSDQTGNMNCTLLSDVQMQDIVNQDPSAYKRVAFDDSWIYYKSNDIDINDPKNQQIMEARFCFARREPVRIITAGSSNPTDWLLDC